MSNNIKITLKDWLSEQLERSDINKYNSFDGLTEKDLYDIAKWGLSQGWSSGAWDDANSEEEAIKNVVDSFKSMLSDKFPEGFNGVPDIITAYRFVVLKNPEDLNRKNWGYSWFTNPNRINNQYFKQQLWHLKTSDLYLITANIPLSNVDVVHTLLQRDSIYVENELVIKDDSVVEFISFKKIY